MADEVTIGRNVPESKSSFIVPNQYKGVSGTHAKVSRGGDGRLYIEDLDSTNGTYVNNLKIKRSPITKSDKITLGGKIGVGYPLQLQSIIELLPISDDEFNHRMNQLKHVWYNHQEQQNYFGLQRQKAASSKMLYLLLAGGIGGIIITIASALGVFKQGSDSAAQIATGIVTLLFSLLAYIIGDRIVASKMTKLNEETSQENIQFQIDYECPACNLFLAKPWDVIASKGECPYCHRKFTPRR